MAPVLAFALAAVSGLVSFGLVYLAVLVACGLTFGSERTFREVLLFAVLLVAAFFCAFGALKSAERFDARGSAAVERKA